MVDLAPLMRRVHKLDWKEKRVLITGISGFVAPVLAKSLLDLGAEVHGFVRRKAHQYTPKRLKQLSIQDELNLVEGNLVDLSSLGRALDTVNPEVVYHLAAQSFIPHSIQNPLESLQTNLMGTANLLEAIRLNRIEPTIIYAGSSEEYGLAISSELQYRRLIEKYGTVFPPPERIPELPIKETAPLRPMSPYAVSKVASDHLVRSFSRTYGLKSIVSRGFNHEGAGRGDSFVTSTIAKQVTQIRLGEQEKIRIGDISAFRDWSHVDDVVEGYIVLAEKGASGEIYNQGSMRTNSVLTFLLWTLNEAGYTIQSVETLRNEKEIKNPLEPDTMPAFGIDFEKTLVDRLLLEGELSFNIEDKGLRVNAGNDVIIVEFDSQRFRVSDVPILLSDSTKIRALGVQYPSPIRRIIRDQLNYFSSAENRMN